MATKCNNNKEDIMDQRNFVIPGFQSLLPIAVDNIYKLDYSHYMVLIEDSYEVLCRQDHKFAKSISLAMFTYYCTILLWVRIYSVLHSRGVDVATCRALVKTCQHYAFRIPIEIELYLVGIGDFYDFESRRAYLLPAAELNRNLNTMGALGSFGKVDSFTHIYYETTPAPIVSLLRMTKDIVFTCITPYWERWDLPMDLAPDISREPVIKQLSGQSQPPKAALLPNVNLLGWKPATRLEAGQLQTLHECGITAYSLGEISNISGLPLQLNLLERVSNAIADSNVIKSTTLPSSIRGSKAQQMYLEVSPDDREFRTFKGTTARKGKMISCCQAEIPIACGAATFRYRQKRQHTKTDNYSFCYLINDYMVPNEWRDNANMIWEWAPKGWMQKKFESNVISFSEAFSHFSPKPSQQTTNIS